MIDSGPGRSQTTSAESDVDANWETGSVRVPLRTRNGTPPLLFGSFDCSRCENDWETVRESNEVASSLADVSDSEGRSPLKGFPSLRPAEMLRRPQHPRYDHSWDLQQDIRSGAFVRCINTTLRTAPSGQLFSEPECTGTFSRTTYEVIRTYRLLTGVWIYCEGYIGSCSDWILRFSTTLRTALGIKSAGHMLIAPNEQVFFQECCDSWSGFPNCYSSSRTFTTRIDTGQLSAILPFPTTKQPTFKCVASVVWMILRSCS